MSILNLTKPTIIAEAGVNHEGDLKTAFLLVDEAKAGGADSIKFQAYKAGKLASKNSPAYWDTSKEKTLSQYELFSKYDGFNESEYRELAGHCKKIGIEFSCTAFDDDAFQMIDPLVGFHKIASADLTNIPFVRLVSTAKKPILLSTGASTFKEIETTLNEIAKQGSNPVTLLHCVLNYPTQDAAAFLSRITELRKAFPGYKIGYSDHTPPQDGCLAVLLSFALGATVFEKHFTHNKKLPGNDHYHSMDKEDLAVLVGMLSRAEKQMRPFSEAAFLEVQAPAILNARRSIVARQNIKKGEFLNTQNLSIKRPGFGISPLHWDEVLSGTAARDIAEDEILRWEDVVR